VIAAAPEAAPLTALVAPDTAPLTLVVTWVAALPVVLGLPVVLPVPESFALAVPLVPEPPPLAGADGVLTDTGVLAALPEVSARVLAELLLAGVLAALLAELSLAGVLLESVLPPPDPVLVLTDPVLALWPATA
jgi:hypothetical protein